MGASPACRRQIKCSLMAVDLSDVDLALRIGQGDREAETEVCRRMAPRIRLYGLRHLRSGSAADDLVQQVLVKMLEALRAGRLREPDKLPQFVLGTCRMTVIDLPHRAPAGAAAGGVRPDLIPFSRDAAARRRTTRLMRPGACERERSVVVLPLR